MLAVMVKPEFHLFQDKSKIDWDSYKSEEGIGDELAIHNRGKDG